MAILSQSCIRFAINGNCRDGIRQASVVDLVICCVSFLTRALQNIHSLVGNHFLSFGLQRATVTGVVALPPHLHPAGRYSLLVSSIIQSGFYEWIIITFWLCALDRR